MLLLLFINSSFRAGIALHKYFNHAILCGIQFEAMSLEIGHDTDFSKHKKKNIYLLQ